MHDVRQLLRNSRWAVSLDERELRRVEGETVGRSFVTGQVVCAQASRADHWLGVMEGMVVVKYVSALGRATSLIAVSRNGWLGEGSLLKDELRPYGVVALRDSVIAFMPSATFRRLLHTSLAFNHFLLDQFNARLAQFIPEHDRFRDSNVRVAHCISEMFNPVLNPNTSRTVNISQEEIGYLSGVSRQYTNGALHRLERAGLIRVCHGSVTVVDLDGLRAFARGTSGTELSGHAPLPTKKLTADMPASLS
jgi:CRP/FNR family cyclic AMP-dependent transcriptional regulator